MAAGYFRDKRGNKSSSRVLGFLVTCYALALSTSVIVLGYIEGTSVIQSAVAAGTVFTTIAGPALFFMFNSKKVEEVNDKQE